MVGEQANNDVTQLLSELSAGNSDAADRLLPHVYQELRALAGSFFQAQNNDHTLQPTALVHEAYLKLVRSDSSWNSRKHFYDIAAMAMRQLLTDYARRKGRQKRGGGAERVTLAEIDSSQSVIDVVALDDAMRRLAQLDQRQARIVELRFLAGLSVEETADVLDLSPRTVKRDWRAARAWLQAQLDGA